MRSFLMSLLPGSPDTQQNLFYTIYLLFAHNFIPIFCLCAIVVATSLALWKPRRSLILFMIGFSLLLFAFEYEKHIEEALKEQTKTSLITERQSATITRAIEVSLGKLIPFGSLAAGLAAVGVGIWLEVPTIKKYIKRRKKERAQV